MSTMPGSRQETNTYNLDTSENMANTVRNDQKTRAPILPALSFAPYPRAFRGNRIYIITTACIPKAHFWQFPMTRGQQISPNLPLHTVIAVATATD